MLREELMLDTASVCYFKINNNVVGMSRWELLFDLKSLVKIHLNLGNHLNKDLFNFLEINSQGLFCRHNFCQK